MGKLRYWSLCKDNFFFLNRRILGLFSVLVRVIDLNDCLVGIIEIAICLFVIQILIKCLIRPSGFRHLFLVNIATSFIRKVTGIKLTSFLHFLWLKNILWFLKILLLLLRHNYEFLAKRTRTIFCWLIPWIVKITRIDKRSQLIQRLILVLGLKWLSDHALIGILLTHQILALRQCLMSVMLLSGSARSVSEIMKVIIFFVLRFPFFCIELACANSLVMLLRLSLLQVRRSGWLIVNIFSGIRWKTSIWVLVVSH